MHSSGGWPGGASRSPHSPGLAHWASTPHPPLCLFLPARLGMHHESRVNDDLVQHRGEKVAGDGVLWVVHHRGRRRGVVPLLPRPTRVVGRGPPGCRLTRHPPRRCDAGWTWRECRRLLSRAWERLQPLQLNPGSLISRLAIQVSCGRSPEPGRGRTARTSHSTGFPCGFPCRLASCLAHSRGSRLKSEIIPSRAAVGMEGGCLLLHSHHHHPTSCLSPCLPGSGHNEQLAPHRALAS